MGTRGHRHHVDDAALARRCLRALAGRGADGLLYACRSLRHAGNPALAHQALWRFAGRDGPCGQREHAGHGRRGSRHGIREPPHRAALGHSAEPRPSCHSHEPSRGRPQSRHLCRVANRAGPLHGHRFHTHACLSRRAVHGERGRRGVRGLHHWQRRKQSCRPLHRGGGGQFRGPRHQLPRVCAFEPAGRGARLLHRRQGAAHEARGRP